MIRKSKFVLAILLLLLAGPAISANKTMHCDVSTIADLEDRSIRLKRAAKAWEEGAGGIATDVNLPSNLALWIESLRVGAFLALKTIETDPLNASADYLKESIVKTAAKSQAVSLRDFEDFLWKFNDPKKWEYAEQIGKRAGAMEVVQSHATKVMKGLNLISNIAVFHSLFHGEGKQLSILANREFEAVKKELDSQRSQINQVYRSMKGAASEKRLLAGALDQHLADCAREGKNKDIDSLVEGFIEESAHIDQKLSTSTSNAPYQDNSAAQAISAFGGYVSNRMNQSTDYQRRIEGETNAIINTPQPVINSTTQNGSDTYQPYSNSRCTDLTGSYCAPGETPH